MNLSQEQDDLQFQNFRFSIKNKIHEQHFSKILDQEFYSQ